MSEAKASPAQAAVLVTPLQGEEAPLFRAYTREELEPRLQAHARWLDSAGRKGTRLDLEDADLRRADLQGARLQQANLAGADLEHANLEGADLRRAVLSGASLRNANLEGANLRKADLKNADLGRARLVGANLSKVRSIETASLRDVDLTDAKGLLGGEFAGLDLTGATLPSGIGQFEGLGHVAELSKHARALFLTVIGACVFSWLTIATTTDVTLITNASSTPLPIIQTHVPIAGFYWAAPALLLTLYLYLHLYMQGLWDSLAGLPAIFPDGRPLDQRAYPWLLTSLVRAHVPLLKQARPAFSILRVWISILAAWMLVPFTLGLFWLRYLPRHELGISVAQFLALAASICAGVLFYRRARATLRRQAKRGSRMSLRSVGLDGFANGALALGFVAVAHPLCADAIFEDPRNAPKGWVSTAVEAVGYRTFADLTEAAVSRRPDTWWQLAKADREALVGVSGAQLRGQDLRYADARGAFLAKADLRYTVLAGAFLDNADLRAAKLFKADMKGARLLRANLQGAMIEQTDLSGGQLPDAKLGGAKLMRANLEGAYLRRADLSAANLNEARLAGAFLEGATLSGADLFEARLHSAMLKNAALDHANLTRATLSGAMLMQANLSNAQLADSVLANADLREANLQDARLRRSQLQGAELLNADLRRSVLIDAVLSGARFANTKLEGALFTGARLDGADLATARGLSQAQLDAACGDRATKLPQGLTIRACPAD